MSNKILVVVDMQNDFVTGALENDCAKAIVPNVVNKVNEAMKNKDIIYFTADTHDDNYLNTEEGINLPVKHCINQTDGWLIVPELKLPDLVRMDTFHMIEKPGFGSVKLCESIAQNIKDRSGFTALHIKEIEVIGICTDICVVSNVLMIKGFCPNVHIAVDAACCAGVTPEAHDHAIATMESCHVEIRNKGEEPWREEEK